MQKLVETKTLTAESPNYWGNASKLFGRLSPPSTPGLLLLTDFRW